MELYPSVMILGQWDSNIAFQSCVFASTKTNQNRMMTQPYAKVLQSIAYFFHAIYSINAASPTYGKKSSSSHWVSDPPKYEHVSKLFKMNSKDTYIHKLLYK